MANSDLLRHRIIKRLTAQRTENVADAALRLWVQMATEVIAIVGEGGFNALYARSIFLTQEKFAWLAGGSPSPQTDSRFAELAMSLEGQSPEQAGEANILLLITFTDILASLIGEHLTISILRSSWGSDAWDRAGKECNNE